MQTDNPERDRFFLGITTLLSFLLLLGMGYLLEGCISKKKAKTDGTTIIYADTTRVKLVHRVQAATQTVTLVHQRTQNSVTAYENAVSKYDSIVVDLR